MVSLIWFCLFCFKWRIADGFFKERAGLVSKRKQKLKKADNVTYEVLRCLLLSVLLIPIINLSVLIKQEKGTFLMCVVFLCITVTHGNDGNPLAFGMARIIDTTVGIVIALVINLIFIFPYDYFL